MISSCDNSIFSEKHKSIICGSKGRKIGGAGAELNATKKTLVQSATDVRVSGMLTAKKHSVIKAYEGFQSTTFSCFQPATFLLGAGRGI